MQLNMDKAKQLKKKKKRTESGRKGDSVVVHLVPSWAAEAERATVLGQHHGCHLFPGSPIFLMSTGQPGKVRLFLELESIAGGGKLGCCFLIWNLRHSDVAAMRQTLHPVSTGGVPPEAKPGDQSQGSHRQLATALGVI